MRKAIRPLKPLALALAVTLPLPVQAAWYWPFDAQEAGKTQVRNGEHEVRDLAYGDALFDYFQQRHFSALTKLRIGEKRGTLDDNAAHADVLRGALFVSFGLLEEAEKIFAQLLDDSVSRDDANQTWYSLADIHYRNGNAAHAHRLLVERIVEPSPVLAPQVHLLDAMALLQLERVDDAAAQLQAISDDRELGMWARYNLAAALASVDKAPEAARIFRSILIMPPADEQEELLQDRAAFALGMTYFRSKEWDAAQNYLDMVRLDGHVAENALLASGWVSVQRQDPVGALTPWLHLAERSPSHPAVQEALLNIPFVYEDAGALLDALNAYRNAESAFVAEKERIEQAKAFVAKPEWIDQLTPQREFDHDPMGPVPEFEFVADGAGEYLYRFMSSNEFSTSYRNYRELQRLSQVLDRWQQQVPAFREMIAANVARMEKLLPQAETTLAMADTFRNNVNARANTLSADIDRALASEDDAATADDQQMQVQERLRAMEQALAGLPDAEYAEEKAKFRLLKGLLAWDLSEQGPDRRWQLVKGRAELDRELNILQAAIADVRSAHQRQLTHYRAHEQRILALENQLASLKEATIQALAHQRVYMRGIAMDIMAQQQTRLDELRGFTLLSIARLQDHAYSATRKPVAPMMPSAITPDGVSVEKKPEEDIKPQREGPQSMLEALDGWFGNENNASEKDAGAETEMLPR